MANNRRWIYSYTRLNGVERVNGVELKPPQSRLQARSEAIGRQAVDRAVEGEKGTGEAKGQYGDL